MIHDLDDGHGASLARFVQQLLSCSKWFLQCLHCNFTTYVTSNLMYIQYSDGQILRTSFGKKTRHSGDVLSIKSLEHTQNLYLEHFQAILRTSQ